MVMLEYMKMMVMVAMVMVENVWEWREEKMTLLPEAVGAGMWKPEYEFPGMHCTSPCCQTSCTAAMQYCQDKYLHAASSHSTHVVPGPICYLVSTHASSTRMQCLQCSSHSKTASTSCLVPICSPFRAFLYEAPALSGDTCLKLSLCTAEPSFKKAMIVFSN